MTVKDLLKIYDIITDKAKEITKFRDINNNEDADIKELLISILLSKYTMKLIDKKFDIVCIVAKYNKTSDIISDEDMEYLDLLEINKMTEEFENRINKLKEENNDKEI